MKKSLVILAVFIAVPLGIYQASAWYVRAHAKTKPDQSFKELDCPFETAALSDQDVLDFIDLHEIRQAETWHEFLTFDKRSCFTEEAIARGLLDPEALFEHSYMNALHASWTGQRAKEVYFYHKILHHIPEHPLADPLIKPRLARLYVKNKGPTQNPEYGYHLMREAVIFSSMVGPFLQNAYGLRKKEKCLEQTSLYTLYQTHLFFWDAPSLLFETQKWLQKLCAMNRKEINRLAKDYALGRGVPQSQTLAHELSR